MNQAESDDSVVKLTSRFENYIREYETSVQQLSHQKLRALHQSAGDAWHILKGVVGR